MFHHSLDKVKVGLRARLGLLKALSSAPTLDIFLEFGAMVYIACLFTDGYFHGRIMTISR